MHEKSFFTFSSDAVFRESFCFKIDLGPIERFGISGESYLHTDYPFFVDDEKKTLAHAAFVLHELEKPDADRLHLKSLLAEDYRNYIECLCGAFSGERSTAAAFTEIMFAYELDETVIQVIKRVQKANELEDDSSIDPDTILDFDQLFIKAGDRALFVGHDCHQAMELYALALFDWQTGRNEDDLEKRSKYRLSRESMQSFQNQVNLLRQIAEKGTFSQDAFTEDSHLSSIFSLYKAAISGFSTVDDERLHAISEILAAIADEFSKSRTITPQNRLMMLLIIQIYKKFLIPILFTFSSRNDCNLSEYKSEILSKIHYLKDTEYDFIISYLNNYAEEEALSKLLFLVSVSILSKKILNCLKVTELNQDTAHYSSIETFSYMFPKESEGECGRLSLMNVSYMNDPNEGILFKHYLYGTQAEKTGPTGRKDVTVPYVFMKCFTSKVDYLPMWEMYGNHAEGCCLIFDWKKTLKNSTEAKGCLYHVCYISKKGTSFTLRKDDNPHIKNLSELKLHLSDLRKTVKKATQKDLIFIEETFKELFFLFKDNSYAYEQEIRILYVFNTVSKRFLHTQEKIPKLYIQPNFPVAIKEIILGPKIRDISGLIPYFQEQVQSMCKMTLMDMPKITISSIDYR